MSTSAARSVAAIGTGIAGAACARALSLAGHAVRACDKSHAPGGRLATRGVEWADRQGRARTARLAHGAVAITARGAALRAFVDRAPTAGWLAGWIPGLAAGAGLAAGGGLARDGGGLCVPVPDLPSLCRAPCAAGLPAVRQPATDWPGAARRPGRDGARSIAGTDAGTVAGGGAAG